MNWSEWEFIWRRQEPPAGPGADIEKLRQMFEASHRRLARALLVRDLSEASAGVCAATFLGAFGLHMGRSGWPFIIVVALILGVSAFFILERIRARRRRVDPIARILDKIEADLGELHRQRRLIENVAIWYIAPLFLAELIVLAAISAHAKPWDLQRNPWFMAAFILFLLAVNFWALRINQRAVRKTLTPRIAELEKLRDDLLSPK